MMAETPLATAEARRWILGGTVQGVGFRPFVYRLAGKHGLAGWIRNHHGSVEIHAQGPATTLANFAHELIAAAPRTAEPRIISSEAAACRKLDGFAILESEADATAEVHLPLDRFACDQCLAEMHDPTNRRYRYPFINCTQCGPRYTMIGRLPYDRPNTTMAGFQMCMDCFAEYSDPANRRFHAEPVACAQCGPQLEFRRSGFPSHYGDEALVACVAALHLGQIVAVKGIGGYHLMCDATSNDAILALRGRKRRPDKPLAVMFPADDELRLLRRHVHMTPDDETFLRSAMRPILLLDKLAEAPISSWVAPDSRQIGAMLPYSPLHDLLLRDFGGALVATSANLSGEPVLTEAAEVEARLAHVADAFLHHDRPIARPADDPVFKRSAGRQRPLRIGRGTAALELELPVGLPQPVLALGGQLKNTIAHGWGRRAVVSPHLGDMAAPRSLALLEETAESLAQIYGVSPALVLCDCHPGYTTTRLARRGSLPVRQIYHHRAHASALAGEYPEHENWLVFTWDGAGYGEDGTVWGGEALLGAPGRWQRVASLRPFSLLGGDRAARSPWRSAMALSWECGENWTECPVETTVLRQAWEGDINCPRSSSAGRLFDAAAALLGLCQEASYEGQAPSYLESEASETRRSLGLPLHSREDGLMVADWQPLITMLLRSDLTLSERASLFHRSLAESIVAQAKVLRDRHGDFRLGLTGGVFQNRLLGESVIALAESEGFAVCLPQRLPCNDAGLSFGQLVEIGGVL